MIAKGCSGAGPRRCDAAAGASVRCRLAARPFGGQGMLPSSSRRGTSVAAGAGPCDVWRQGMPESVLWQRSTMALAAGAPGLHPQGRVCLVAASQTTVLSGTNHSAERQC